MASTSEQPKGSQDKPWETEEGCRKMADILRGRRGMTTRHAAELGKRIEFFRGDKLITYLLESKTIKKTFPALVDKEDAISVGRALLHYEYIHRSEREGKNRKVLVPSTNHNFALDGYFTWMYDGQKFLRNFLTAVLIIGFLMCTCFPIWPQWAKVAVWYFSVTFLIFIIIFSIVRLIVFFLLWMVGYEFWIYPNIFDDDLGVIDSFKPLYSFRATAASERIYRIVAILCFIMFCFWVNNQPTDFDEYMELTKQFTDDLYSGKLLSDMAQTDKDGIDSFKVPDLKELMKEDEEDKDDVTVDKEDNHDVEGDDAEGDDNSKNFEKTIEELDTEDELEAEADAEGNKDL